MSVCVCVFKCLYESVCKCLCVCLCVWVSKTVSESVWSVRAFLRSCCQYPTKLEPAKSRIHRLDAESAKESALKLSPSSSPSTSPPSHHHWPEHPLSRLHCDIRLVSSICEDYFCFILWRWMKDEIYALIHELCASCYCVVIDLAEAKRRLDGKKVSSIVKIVQVLVTASWTRIGSSFARSTLRTLKAFFRGPKLTLGSWARKFETTRTAAFRARSKTNRSCSLTPTKRSSPSVIVLICSGSSLLFDSARAKVKYSSESLHKLNCKPRDRLDYKKELSHLPQQSLFQEDHRREVLEETGPIYFQTIGAKED